MPVDSLDGFPQIGERARAISRGSKTETVVAMAATGDGTHCGHGECVPYPRYGESPDRVVAAIHAGATGYCLLLAKERPSGLRSDGNLIYPPDSTLRG